MPNRVLQWNPFHSSSFASYDGKLKLFEILEVNSSQISNLNDTSILASSNYPHTLIPSVGREARVVKFRKNIAKSEVTTVDWFRHISHPHLMAVGNAAGQITLVDWATDRDTTISKPSKYGPRTCTEVAWNKQILGQLAAGFDRLRSEDCTCVYDVESALVTSAESGSGSGSNSLQQLTATHKFSFGDGCVSLNWIPQNPNLLAVGTTTGWMRVYDLRKGHPAAMSVMAHTNIRSKKVKGIRSDPFNSNLLATFSDSAGEPVKVWDLRKVEKSKEAPVFTVHPHGVNAPAPSSTVAGGAATGVTNPIDSSKSSVTDIEFSPVRSNVLAVGISKADSVLFFSTKSSSNDIQTRTPILTINVPNGVKYLSWHNSQEMETSPLTEPNEKESDIFDYGGDKSEYPHTESSLQDQASSLSQHNHHRLLVASRKMSYVDLTVVERQPLAINAQNDVIFGRNSTFAMLKSNQVARKTADASSGVNAMQNHFGIDDHLIRRRCAAGYAVDSGQNLQTLSDELDELDPISAEASACIQLLRAWSWVDRVETLHIKDGSFNLQNSGILRLLRDDNANRGSNDSGSENSVTYDKGLLHPTIGRAIYLSPRRSVGRLLCGWAALHGLEGRKAKQNTATYGMKDNTSVEHSESANLQDIVHDCEMVEHFERGAAIAMWHGDLVMAVKVLQRTIASNSGDSGYIETLSDTSNADDNDDDENSQEEDDEHGEDDIGYMSETVNDSVSIATANSKDTSTTTSNDSFLSAEYVELLSLVAMCIAGYSGQASNEVNNNMSGQGKGNKQSSKSKEKSSLANSKSSMWSSMCKVVLTKLKSSEISTGRRGASYLHAACLFLLETQQGCENYSVLEDEHIAFEDRVAFACTYLSYKQMTTFLLRLENQCMKEGNIEGLVITGLKTSDGMALLQRYVDLRNDIQTAALLVARFSSTLDVSSNATNQLSNKADAAQLGEGVDHDSSAISGKGSELYRSGMLEKQFLQEYRTLLNRWELYMARASLDVELGRRYRAHQALNGKKPSNGNDSPQGAGMGKGSKFARSGGRGSGGGGSGSGDKSANGSVYRIPPHNDSPHVLLRCYYCSSSLPVDCMLKQHQTSAWLRRQRPVMNCCPQCKKPLPKCYICLSFMGLLNPQVEVRTTLERRNHASTQALHLTENSHNSMDNDERDVQELQHHNVFDYGKWFIWCQNCKHGGHANCIDSWFHLHDECGVNGCKCSCRMDQLQKREKLP